MPALESCAPQQTHPPLCSYSTWDWDVTLARAVGHRRIVKDYAALTAQEVDGTTGCSVCEEDQVTLTVSGIPPFQVCRHLAAGVDQALRGALQSGARIAEVVGYRVGYTRGELGAQGRRTQFSNHSYGTALDVNPAYNGLYDHCHHFGPQCHLLRGGPWRPDSPWGLSSQHSLVQQLSLIGLRWGGEISGVQKDYMHFSPSGY